jgi:hypothetical protein
MEPPTEEKTMNAYIIHLVSNSNLYCRVIVEDIEQVIAITPSLTEGLLNRGNANGVFHPKHLETQNSANN